MASGFEGFNREYGILVLKQGKKRRNKALAIFVIRDFIAIAWFD